MSSLLVNQFQLHYQLAGHGTPVVFLHGLGSSAADWALQVPAFAAHHQVLTLDLRGHGDSTFNGTLRIEHMAQDVAALLTELALGPAHVVGLSMGGCVALALGIQHAPLVRSLTLVNTFAKYQAAGWAGLKRGFQRLWLLQTGSMNDMAACVAGGLFPQPEQKQLYEAAVASLSRNPKHMYRAAIAAILRFDVTRQLNTIRLPTLVVLGERDQTVPRGAGELLVRSIPNARRWLVANSGHATPMDQHELFNETVLGFVGEIEGELVTR
jgi:pimeloyl-ACP methyl ester carboxylesterase